MKDIETVRQHALELFAGSSHTTAEGWAANKFLTFADGLDDVAEIHRRIQERLDIEVRYDNRDEARALHAILTFLEGSA